MDNLKPEQPGVKIPEFSEDKLTMLRQLKQLADERVPNEVWYTISWMGNEAAYVVGDLLDAGIFYEEGARARGEKPMKFIDFITTRLDEAVQKELKRGKIIESIPVTPVQDPAAFEVRRQTADEVNKMIRTALGRRSVGNRRQYSNRHSRPRR